MDFRLLFLFSFNEEINLLGKPIDVLAVVALVGLWLTHSSAAPAIHMLFMRMNSYDQLS